MKILFFSLCVFLLVSCQLKRNEPSSLLSYTIPVLSSAGIKVDATKNEAAWKSAVRIDSFADHWNKRINPETAVSLIADDKYLYFFFEVYDDDIVMMEDFTDETCVVKEDRVELFFSGDKALRRYYGFEIDPLGRVLDYQAEYYRKFHNEWNCRDIITCGKIHGKTYSVEGAIPLSFLKDLADENNELFWGAYRGEFSRGDNGEIIENWMSIKDPETAEPDFHVPTSFCKMKLMPK